MGKLSTTFKKEEVFYLTREVRNLIKLLEDINTIDENKLNNIINNTLETIHVDNVKNKPDHLFFILINMFLKNDIIDPINTTGWILVGSSP